MRVVFGHPPNYRSIVAAFPMARNPGTIFCYGDTIFSTLKSPLPIELHAHEAVHSGRQIAAGVEAWWDHYLRDPQFRFDEEFPAHVAEIKAVVGGRKAHESALQFAARRLSGGLYGNLISMDDAVDRLRKAL